jgi:hypothetical protein
MVIIDNQVVLTTNCFFPKEIENEAYKSLLYLKGVSLVTISEDAELNVNKDTRMHDNLGTG